MEFKISVIVPCYNAEETLKRCIDSIINQSFGFESIELILYDDASTDNTRLIIQNHANKYPNVVPIFSDKNQGPGKGRNQGIESATSDYIMFIDADDEYDLDLCNVMFNKIINSDYDLICCRAVNIIDGTTQEETLDETKKGEFIEFLNDETLYFKDVHPFNKLYKKSIINNNDIYFPEHRFGEDLHFNIRYFKHCNKIIYFPHYLGYFRHVKNDSISRSWKLDDLSRVVDTFLEIYDELSVANLNVDFNRVFKQHVEYILLKLCTLHLLDDKVKAIKILEELYLFEQKISFNAILDSKIIEIANKFLLKKQFNSTYYYLKSIEKLYNLDKIKSFYRKILSVRRKNGN